MSGKGAVDPSGFTPNPLISGPCYGHNGDVQNKPAADVVPRDLSQAHLDDSWPMPCFVEGPGVLLKAKQHETTGNS